MKALAQGFAPRTALQLAGLALGLALGTKFTFAAPVVVMVVGRAWIAGAGRRLRDLALLGLPCLLTGTGMAFPWELIRGANLATGNIVEDMSPDGGRTFILGNPGTPPDPKLVKVQQDGRSRRRRCPSQRCRPPRRRL